MPTAISGVAQAGSRGTFILYKQSPTAAKAQGTGRAAIVGQLPWGPLDSEIAFVDAKTFRKKFAPDGFPRTGSLYLMATKYAHADLQIVRILGSTPVTAFAQLVDGSAVNAAKVNGKYPGSAGNSISTLTETATDAVSTHRKLTVSIADPTTGLSTIEIYDNFDFSKPIGDAYYTSQFANSLLVASITRQAGSTPAVGTVSMATGTDGSAITSANYLGTPSSGDKGVAVLENDPLVRFVMADEVASGIAAAVNAGLKAHEILMTNRIALLSGQPAETDSTAKSNAATYANANSRTLYSFPHHTVPDDQQVTRTIPSTAGAAALMSAIQPHLSPAFKAEQVRALMSSVNGLDYGTGSPSMKTALEAANVFTWETNPDGSITPYNDQTTDGLPVYVARMQDYIGFSLATALQGYQNGPNDAEQFAEERGIVDSFLAQLVRNRSLDHINKVSIVDYEIYPVEASNAQADIDNGDFIIGFQVKLISAQKRIFLIGEIGTTVTIQAQIAA